MNAYWREADAMAVWLCLHVALILDLPRPRLSSEAQDCGNSKLVHNDATHRKSRRRTAVRAPGSPGERKQVDGNVTGILYRRRTNGTVGQYCQTPAARSRTD